MSTLVTISRYAETSGYSVKAIERKIEEGIWLANTHYVKGPDGRIFIYVANVERWLLKKEPLALPH